jgi:hypothetical protein
MNGSRKEFGRVALVGLALVAAVGCSGRARTALDEVSGVDRSELAGRLASEGISVGNVRTVALPDGTQFAIVTPQPSDGFSPQVSIVRLDAGNPLPDTESICDPFVFASTVTGDQFPGLDPVRIDSVAWEAWLGGDRRDLVVELSTEATWDQYGGSPARSELRARCIFRRYDDANVGPLAVAILGLLERASSVSDYSGQRTDQVEAHEVAPVEGQPDQLDLLDNTRLESCSPDAEGRTLCVPETTITIRRYALVGQGVDSSYMPLGQAGYNYRYNRGGGYPYPGGAGPVDDTGVVYGPGTEPCDDPEGCPTPGYDDTGAGYTPGTEPCDDPAGCPTPGYDDTSTGYDDAAGGYQEESAGSDEEETGEPTGEGTEGENEDEARPANPPPRRPQGEREEDSSSCAGR